MPRGPSGCWTCRVRHRKCGLETPSCKECTDRHVYCHGYGPKPTWMDGGSEEQKERSRIKAAINQNFRHVKKRQNRARMSRSLSEQSRPLPGSRTNQANGSEGEIVADESPISVATPPRPLHSSYCPNDLGNAALHHEEDSSDRAFELNENNEDHTLKDAAELTTTPIPQSLGSNGLDPQEAYLLMYYLDRVFPWQFPYHDRRSRLGNKGWLFLLLMKRGPLYHAALSLASLHQSAMIGTEEEFQRRQKALGHHSQALRELCDLMTEKGDKLRDDHAQLTEFLTCSFMLISFEVFSGAENDWLMHLDAVASVMSLLSPEVIFSAHPYHHNAGMSALELSDHRIGGSDGLEFLVVSVIWFDVFSCLSTGRAPRLPYQRWLQIPGLNTADLMGCYNWVVAVIGDLARLGVWKDQQDKDGLLNIRELASRGQEIEMRLEKGIEGLDIAKGYTGSESLKDWVTRLFALAALVLLHTTISGPLPALPEIRSAVARSIIALRGRPESYSLTGSSVGAMRQYPDGFQNYEELLENAGDYAGGL
ncbi:hypothetical protein KXW30_001370 [Aspergillus fumigatus]|nr:hypothetical protein KXX63_008654 [Aspergillus fumigatus]KAH2342337.1 hypothetical protein KXW30_001370 [Aspergillus fumigatus]